MHTRDVRERFGQQKMIVRNIRHELARKQEGLKVLCNIRPVNYYKAVVKVSNPSEYI